MGKVETTPRCELLTETEAAKYLGCKPQTLAVWRCSGRYKLRFTKIGRLVRYKKADLDAFVEHRSAVHT